MQMVPHNPTTGVYAATADYIHAMEARSPDRLLFVAGTLGLDPAGMSVDNIVRLTSYLRSASYAAANARARTAALGGRFIPTTAIVADLLDTVWLVEIDVIAAG